MLEMSTEGLYFGRLRICTTHTHGLHASRHLLRSQ